MSLIILAAIIIIIIITVIEMKGKRLKSRKATVTDANTEC